MIPAISIALEMATTYFFFTILIMPNTNKAMMPKNIVMKVNSVTEKGIQLVILLITKPYAREKPLVIASQTSGLFLRIDRAIKTMTKKVKMAPLIMIGRNFFITTIVIFNRDY